MIPSLSRFERVALVGVGNELNADDAAGVLVVRELRSRLPEGRSVLLIEGATAPENFTGVLRRFAPDLVVLIDAAYLGEAPGATAWFGWEQVEGLSASTHTLPPSVLAKYMIHEFGCVVTILGIQPVSVEFGGEQSAVVLAAVAQVVDELAISLAEISTPIH